MPGLSRNATREPESGSQRDAAGYVLIPPLTTHPSDNWMIREP